MYAAVYHLRRHIRFLINCVLKEKSSKSFNLAGLTFKQKKKQGNILNIFEMTLTAKFRGFIADLCEQKYTNFWDLTTLTFLNKEKHLLLMAKV